MVIKGTIDTLKERPHDERHALAVLSAVVVMVIVLIAWGVIFFKDIQDNTTDGFQNMGTSDASGQSAAAAAASLRSIIQSTVTSDIGAQAPADIELPTVADTLYGTSSQPAVIPDEGSVAAQLQAALEQ